MSLQYLYNRRQSSTSFYSTQHFPISHRSFQGLIHKTIATALTNGMTTKYTLHMYVKFDRFHGPFALNPELRFESSVLIEPSKTPIINSNKLKEQKKANKVAS